MALCPCKCQSLICPLCRERFHQPGERHLQADRSGLVPSGPHEGEGEWRASTAAANGASGERFIPGSTRRREEIACVTADGAYDPRKCHDAIAERGAHAVIPPRKNAQPWKDRHRGCGGQNEPLRATKYLGRTIWRNRNGSHRRSRAETKMRGLKPLGQRLMARDFDRQVAEVQARIAVMNGYTAPGIPVTKTVG